MQPAQGHRLGLPNGRPGFQLEPTKQTLSPFTQTAARPGAVRMASRTYHGGAQRHLYGEIWLRGWLGELAHCQKKEEEQDARQYADAAAR